jgi:hypothetical protein
VPGGDGLDGGQVGGGHHRCLVDDQQITRPHWHVSAAGRPVAGPAQEPGQVVALGQAFGGERVGGVGGHGQPDDPAGPGLVPGLGDPGDGPGLPGSGGADEDVDCPAGGQDAVGGLRLVVGQARAGQWRLRAVRRLRRAVCFRGCAGLRLFAPQPRLDPVAISAEGDGRLLRINLRAADLRGGPQQARLGVELGAGGVDLRAVAAPQAQPVRAPVGLRDRDHLGRGQLHDLARAAGMQGLAGEFLQ